MQQQQQHDVFRQQQQQQQDVISATAAAGCLSAAFAVLSRRPVLVTPDQHSSRNNSRAAPVVLCDMLLCHFCFHPLQVSLVARCLYASQPAVLQGQQQRSTCGLTCPCYVVMFAVISCRSYVWPGVHMPAQPAVLQGQQQRRTMAVHMHLQAGPATQRRRLFLRK
jgi:hypothetical protein